jgi:6-phosphogluconate dehydrogenase
MGSIWQLRLQGVRLVVHDEDPASREKLAASGAVAVDSLAALVSALQRPRPIWMMIPDKVVDSVIAKLADLLDRDDILIDGGNTYFPDDVRRARQLADQGIAYVDVGTSGGVWGRERGYCLMIGGQQEAVQHLDPVFRTLAPAHDSVATTPGSPAGSTADQGYALRAARRRTLCENGA